MGTVRFWAMYDDAFDLPTEKSTLRLNLIKIKMADNKPIINNKK